MQNVPLPQRSAGPQGWMLLTMSVDPSTPPMHLCGMCGSQFTLFMGNHKHE